MTIHVIESPAPEQQNMIHLALRRAGLVALNSQGNVIAELLRLTGDGRLELGLIPAGLVRELRAAGLRIETGSNPDSAGYVTVQWGD